MKESEVVHWHWEANCFSWPPIMSTDCSEIFLTSTSTIWKIWVTLTAPSSTSWRSEDVCGSFSKKPQKASCKLLVSWASMAMSIKVVPVMTWLGRWSSTVRRHFLANAVDLGQLFHLFIQIFLKFLFRQALFDHGINHIGQLCIDTRPCIFFL